MRGGAREEAAVHPEEPSVGITPTLARSLRALMMRRHFARRTIRAPPV